jgi:type IV secretion system protein VirB4
VGLELLAGGVLLGAGLRGLVSYLAAPRGEEGFADGLLYGVPVAEGVLLNRDASLMVALRLRGPDYSSSTSEEMSTMARVVHGALERLSERFLIAVDAVRRRAVGYAGEGDFPDPVSRALDAERRERFGSQDYWVTETVLCLAFSPPPEVYRRAARFFETGRSEGVGEWSEHARGFERDVAVLEAELARALRVEQLSTEELAGHLRCCIVGEEASVRVPEDVEVELAYLVGAEDFLGGFKPQIGGRHLRVIAVHGYPSTARSDAMEPFHTIPFACRSSHRIQLLSRQAGEKLIRGEREKWWHAFQGLRGAPAPQHEIAQKVFTSGSAGRQAVDAAEALDESVEGSTRYALYTWALVVTDRDEGEVERKARYLEELFSSRGFVATRETWNAPAAYLGSLPGQGSHNVRRPILSVRSLSALLPLTSPWLGHELCPSELLPEKSPPPFWGVTEGQSTPYRFHIHSQGSPHGLVLGRTGAGKSVFLGFLGLQFLRWPSSRVWVFDHDFSSGFWVLAAGGEHYELSPSSKRVQFQPFARVDEVGEKAWAAGYLELLLELQGLDVEAEHREEIWQGLALLEKEPVRERTVSSLRRYIDSQEVKAALKFYTREGACGVLLDGGRDSFGTARLQAFEMTRLLESGERVVLPVLSYLFWRVERSLDDGQAPSLLLIDEAWRALLHPVWAERINAWLRRLRKRNAGVWLATQHLDEILGSEFASVILDSCPSRVVLPDSSARERLEVYGRGSSNGRPGLGLNATEIELLAGAQRRREYLHTSDEGTRLFELALDPLALRTLTPPAGRTVEEMYRVAVRWRERDGAGWFRSYLESEGEEELSRRIPA